MPICGSRRGRMCMGMSSTPGMAACGGMPDRVYTDIDFTLPGDSNRASLPLCSGTRLPALGFQKGEVALFIPDACRLRAEDFIQDGLYYQPGGHAASQAPGHGLS